MADPEPDAEHPLMRPLWAPWRMQYLKAPKTEGCPLCEALANDRLIVHRGNRVFVIMNLYPYSNGHMMVAPIEHVAGLNAIDAEVAAEMLELTRRAIDALTRTSRPEGFNVGFNLGKAAGAGIDDHLHQHVVPRWLGDTNFMPVLGGAKVIGEAVEETLANIRAVF